MKGSDISRAKAVVTGGAGFIGSHLVELLLSEGCAVTVIDNFSSGRKDNLAAVKDRITMVEADLARPGAWQAVLGDADFVFHLAALADIVPSIQRPGDYFRANVDGTFHVLDTLRENRRLKRFVYAASSSCYGVPDVYPTPEEAPIQPRYPYALTKYLGEALVLHWAQVYRLPAVSLRLFNVYGPRARTSGTYGAVFGVFLAQKLAGEPFTVVGDGTQTRDFVYVGDVARAFWAAAHKGESGEVYNIGAGRPVSVNRIVELIGGEAVHIPKRPGEPDCTHADIRKARARLGWSPRVTIEEGVARLLEHIDYWREAPVWTPEAIEEQTRDWFTYLSR